MLKHDLEVEKTMDARQLKNDASTSGFAIGAVAVPTNTALTARFGVLFVVDNFLGLDAHVYDVGCVFTKAALCACDRSARKT